MREIAGTLADMLLAIHGLGNRAGFGMRVSKRDLNTCRWLMKGSRELLESYESLKNSDEFYKGTKFE